MEAITAALVALDIDTDNAQKYAQKLWEQGVTTPELLALVHEKELTAAEITRPTHVKAILAGAKNVPVVSATVGAINGMSATEIVGLLKAEGTKNAKLAAMCCEKIGQIVNADKVGRMQFVNAGACEPVVAVLRAWMKTDALVVQWACAAIKVLSRGDTERSLLGGLGACEAVIAALIAWGKTDARVVEWGCSAVRNLTVDNDANRTRLGNSGACEAVVAALIAWGKSDTEVAGAGCGAVKWLSYNNSANKQRLIKVGAVAAVQGTMSSNNRDDALNALRG